jgi:DNA-binding transcriptional ArsR family regulator
MTDNDPTAESWDDASFVLASQYRVAVLDRLARGPAIPSQIATDTEISISHVSRALTDLRERSLGELLVSEERQKGRVYGLTDRGTEIVALVEEMETTPTE